VQKTTDAVVTEFGRLDVMVANAGIPSKAGGLDDKLEDWHRVVDIDFSGAYYCARVAGEIFRRQGSGNLIFTASMSGHAVNFPQQQVSNVPSQFSFGFSIIDQRDLSRPVTMPARPESSSSRNPSLSNGWDLLA
jgi:NAD(P)-dependent dehydrogenase (short-subunit alcohol dehydrogenase family)